jgi:amidohydrolase
MITQAEIKKIAVQYFSETVKIRRYLHSHPELAFCEKETSSFVVSELEKLKIKYEKNIAGYGIVAFIEGKKKSKNPKLVALRADMDALPIEELNKVPYASKNKGLMHACGHDAHTSSLLGAARILKSVEADFSGTVMLIFQPAEEKLPGGAKAMIDLGILKKHKPDYIIAQHVEPALDAGTVGFKPGIYMASTDEIYLTVEGKGGHGAMPHLNIDTVLIASHIVVALQQIVSRLANPGVPTVLSFGKIIGNGATNIIPDVVKIDGTFRTTNEKWRKDALLKIKQIANDVAKSMGGACNVKIEHGYPALINDELATAQAKDVAINFLGKSNVHDLELRMTAEDFAYFAQQAPSVFYRLGVRNEKKKITSSIHTATFDIDEESLKTGMGLMAWLALSFLNSK